MKHAQIKKINPYSRKSEFKLDGTPNFNDRVEIGPTQLAFEEWTKAEIEGKGASTKYSDLTV